MQKYHSDKVVLNILVGGGGLGEVEAWPFSELEWQAVRDAALPVINASLAGDAILEASHLGGLLDVLADLRARYGDHPVLLETEADFTEDDSESAALYQRAVGIAEANGIQTLSIRLSLARVLLDLNRPADAAAELLACEGELPGGDEFDQVAWLELVTETKKFEPRK